MIAAAGRDARAADAAFVAHSKERLGELLRLLPRQRFDHLDDKALTPADRTALRRSVMATLRHRPGAWLLGGWMRLRRRAGVSFKRALLHPALWLVLGLGGAWFAMAWSHTPRMAYSEVAQPVDLYGPQGFVTSYTFPPKTLIAIQQMTNDQALVRIWLPGQGYLLGLVPRRGLILGR